MKIKLKREKHDLSGSTDSMLSLLYKRIRELDNRLSKIEIYLRDEAIIQQDIQNILTDIIKNHGMNYYPPEVLIQILSRQRIPSKYKFSLSLCDQYYDYTYERNDCGHWMILSRKKDSKLQNDDTGI